MASGALGGLFVAALGPRATSRGNVRDVRVNFQVGLFLSDIPSIFENFIFSGSKI